MDTPKTDDGALLKSTNLLSSSLAHLVVLHRVLYGTIDKTEALEYLHSHLRDDTDIADMGRPLKYQYKDSTDTPIRQRIEFLENSLRDIALFVSVGGYNNDEIPDDIVDRIKDGIVALCATQRKTQTEKD